MFVFSNSHFHHILFFFVILIVVIVSFLYFIFILFLFRIPSLSFPLYSFYYLTPFSCSLLWHYYRSRVSSFSAFSFLYHFLHLSSSAAYLILLCSHFHQPSSHPFLPPRPSFLLPSSLFPCIPPSFVSLFSKTFVS